MQDANSAEFNISDDGTVLSCLGNWTVQALRHIEHDLRGLSKRAKQVTTIDVSSISQLDSAGALLLQDTISRVRDFDNQLRIIGLPERYQKLFYQVGSEQPKLKQPISIPDMPNCFYRIGERTMQILQEVVFFMSFVGELATSIFKSAFRPSATQWRTAIYTMDESGYQALPIIGLMIFLIGIVLAYQLGSELRVYGADIYVVDVTGVAILREFGPLITAVIMAGRTSTSFAALIGTMKVNEEIDVLRTMGVTPIERIVLPRLLGLVLAMPLLTVWADFFGVMGSMAMSKGMLNITFATFMERFQHVVALKQYVLGLIKAPVFALVIAVVGCFQGFKVGVSAESVGQQTTRAAVQAIFLIIIVDAGFSVIYSAMGL